MSVWATLVYVLCSASSAACAFLLVRSYIASRNRLLLWSAICFVLLALNNLAVVSDIVLLPNADLSIVRILSSLGGVGALLYGFIFEVES
jgi:hypothetical protein